MGKLNIAHHKSYHPYRRDNIERVRRDEEEARQKEAIEEGRMMLAVRSQYIRSVWAAKGVAIGLGSAYGPPPPARGSAGLKSR